MIFFFPPSLFPHDISEQIGGYLLIVKNFPLVLLSAPTVFSSSTDFIEKIQNMMSRLPIIHSPTVINFVNFFVLFLLFFQMFVLYSTTHTTPSRRKLYCSEPDCLTSVCLSPPSLPIFPSFYSFEDSAAIMNCHLSHLTHTLKSHTFLSLPFKT